MNPMREIRIEKITLNMGCADDKDKLKRSKKLLETISGQKVVITKTHKRTTFGMAKGRPIGVKVTMRKEKAKEFFKQALEAVEKKLKEKQVGMGIFSIGIKEYIDLPIKYDPEIGIIGLDVCVTLERPGFRVKRRSIRKSRVGKKHLITKQDTIDWLKKQRVKIE